MAQTRDYEDHIIQGHALFARDLYGTLSKNNASNLFFSPIALHSTLSMAFQGARGATAESLAKVLHVSNDIRAVAKGYKLVTTQLNCIQNVTLLMANNLFVDDETKLLDSFKTSSSKHFLVTGEQVHFAHNIRAADSINSWIQEKTKNKIENIITPDDLNELTRLVLVNAVYFKGNWDRVFDKKKTRTAPFYPNDNEEIDVEMMHIKKVFHYKRDPDLDAQVLELPYYNKNVCLVAVLPNERNGIEDLESKLSTFDLSKLTTGMWKKEIDVSLPKFKIETTNDLKEPLTKLGLDVVFDADEACFRGMVELKPGEKFYVSKLVQKTFMEVNEEGAEAAVAIATPMFKYVKRHILPEFEANHPFIFFIIDCQSKIILFAGKIVRP